MLRGGQPEDARSQARAPPRGYRKFVRDTFLLVPAERKRDALRLTSPACIATLRKMLTKWSVEGSGYFFHLDALQPPSRGRGAARASKRIPSSEASPTSEPLHATHFSHPSLCGVPLVDAVPDSETAARRRAAAALLLSALRFCDCVEPLDTLVLDGRLLDDWPRLWDALVVCSEGRLFMEHVPPTELSRPGVWATPWLRGRSFFGVGAFVASCFEVLMARFLLQHMARIPMGAPPAAATWRRASAEWWAGLPAGRRMGLMMRWLAELKRLLAQRRRLLSLPGGGGGGSGATSHGTTPSSPPGEPSLLLQLLEALTAAPSELSQPPPPRGVLARCRALLRAMRAAGWSWMAREVPELSAQSRR